MAERAASPNAYRCGRLGCGNRRNRRPALSAQAMVRPPRRIALQATDRLQTWLALQHHQGVGASSETRTLGSGMRRSGRRPAGPHPAWARSRQRAGVLSRRRGRGPPEQQPVSKGERPTAAGAAAVGPSATRAMNVRQVASEVGVAVVTPGVRGVHGDHRPAGTGPRVHRLRGRLCAGNEWAAIKVPGLAYSAASGPNGDRHPWSSGRRVGVPVSDDLAHGVRLDCELVGDVRE